MSRLRFMPAKPMMRCRSKPRAEPQGFCAKAIAIFLPKDWRRITARCALRARIEKIFGTWKRSYRFRHMRWIGLSKAKLQVHLAVIAYNFKRYWRLQTA